MKSNKRSTGVTMVELVVVLLILSLLSTIALSVHTGSVRRAQFTVARTEIRQLELAAARYEVDLGVFPPSSSGTQFGTLPPNPTANARFNSTDGAGYLTLALQHSLSGNALQPADPRWRGPYMEIQQNKMASVDGTPITASTPPPKISIIDPWGSPYFYVRSQDYQNFNAAKQTNTPFAALGETFYNPSTFQIFSLGPDGVTSTEDPGLGPDDVNNFDNVNVSTVTP